ncbi:DUF4258 domain-containing protein [Senegalia sp. (in: firmicutes)]|uniref:DUF4258 domain-containing protein n=1 Tax=Senegalia sp. (in: firmicutes) TaxID=1924098 RepID=UPI003F9B5338
MIKEIIEYYEEDYPYSSCLILGSTNEDKIMHVVCALERDNICMITAYYSAPSECLDDFKTRRS